ncbi:dihydroorotase [Lentilitoribacter sp. EG35]|uniref:dihydroorotase n=1 Tax=Lentilitoribacter sp. EG35 TaxID=3234192 RepID=UPI0034603CA9
MNSRVLKNIRIIDPSQGLDEVGTIIIEDGKISACGAKANNQGSPEGAQITDYKGATVASPGLVDARVYIGEPGSEYRETIASAGQAAAKGGITSIITMPDTDPVIDDVALLQFIQRTARDTSVINVLPSAAITKSLKGLEMTEFGLMTEAGAACLTDGRKTLRNAAVLRRAMTYARDFDALISCELQDADLADGGMMNEGLLASWLGFKGIPSEAEIIPLERDLRLAHLTGAKYHAAKLSTPETATLIARAKQNASNISAGISINNLTLNENDIGEYRTFFKLSPPLRSEEDRLMMVKALADGTIDIICSSHDPQDVDTKRLPFPDAAEGAIGLETMLAAALRLYHSSDVSLPRLIDAMSCRPAQLHGLNAGTLKVGTKADIAIIDLEYPWVYAKNEIVSKSKNSAFEDARFTGKVIETIVSGKTVYSDV